MIQTPNSTDQVAQTLKANVVMSADCESVVAPLAPQSLPLATSLQSNAPLSERLSYSGISYEGRLSLISPLTTYESDVRTAFGLEQSTHRHLVSPPFRSVPQHGALQPRLQEPSPAVPYPEDSCRRNDFLSGVDLWSLASSSRDFRNGGGASHGVNPKPFNLNHMIPPAHSQANDNNFIKHENRGNFNSASSFYDPESLFKYQSKNSCHDNGINQQSGNSNDTVEEGDRNGLPEQHQPDASLQTPKQEDYLMNSYEDCEPPSPYRYNGQDDNGPLSNDSSPEIDADHLMNDDCSRSPQAQENDQEAGDSDKAYRCTFCSYSSDSEYHYNTHLNSHYDQKCTKCDYTTRTDTQLKQHFQEEHGMTAEESFNQEGIKVPRVHSQAKAKTFKCKQCSYRAVTKGDFWKHVRTHIKPEKLLACDKCFFVTEYKHHLEYHLRNHYGSKPYKCNKCNYTCVNKSMLNSHMKSHSNIYQYRCADCTYATKYCHSLKLHLRKYRHTPAMVLNPDGSPNPVPIIDVYGTRRGPKLKKDENGMPILPPQYQLQAHLVRAHMEVTGTIPHAPTAPPEKPSSAQKNHPMQQNVPMPPFSLGTGLPPFPSLLPQDSKFGFDNLSNNAVDSREEQIQKQRKMEDSQLASKSNIQEALKCLLCNFTTLRNEEYLQHLALHSETKEKEAKSKPKRMTPPEMNSLPLTPTSFSFGGPTELQPSRPPLPPLAQFSAAQNIQEYIARAMNPLFYPPILNRQQFVHPALELQQQLQRLAYQATNSTNPPPATTIPNEPQPTPPRKEEHIFPSPQTPEDRLPNFNEVVLDLSKEQTPPNMVTSTQASSSSSNSSPPVLPTTPPTSDVSTPPTKHHRRKGRAYKLERIALRLSGSGEEGETSGQEGEDQRDPNEPTTPQTKTTSQPPPPPTNMDSSSHSDAREKDASTPDDANAPVVDAGQADNWAEAHHCQYCDIAFKDLIMYTMHMGYHGYRDPFTCNMCGFHATDKVSFFLHIGRSSHL